jgi:predicted TIM-barrel fold metal-dependent hydrolase
MTETTLPSRIRTVGVEEHAWIPSLRDRLMAEPAGVIDDSLPAFNQHERGPRLIDLGEERLRLMDDAGIDMQVLSTTTPGTQSLPAGEARAFAREANDALSHAVAEHPDRFAAFATLPTPDPDAAAAELERAITQLGFVGAMLFPRTGERYVDADEFRPIFEVAAELRVPLYLHPEIAPHSMRAAYYSGFSPDIDLLLATGGWGWHSDTGVSALRLILAGTFDRHPRAATHPRPLGRDARLLHGARRHHQPCDPATAATSCRLHHAQLVRHAERHLQPPDAGTCHRCARRRPRDVQQRLPVPIRTQRWSSQLSRVRTYQPRRQGEDRFRERGAAASARHQSERDRMIEQSERTYPTESRDRHGVSPEGEGQRDDRRPTARDRRS